MFGSDVLDIVVGMVFIFLLLSLICSALKEFIETMVKNRAKDLERGIRELIGDPSNATNFVDKIYNHALVNSLFRGVYSEEKLRDLPSYIPSASFAMTVMDLIKNPPEGLKLPPNVKAAYDIFEQRAAGDAAKLQASLEDWFNAGMDRVSGWYKRRAQWILVTLGLAVAVAVNADAIRIAQALSNDASLRKGLVAMAQAKANEHGQTNATDNGSQQTGAGGGSSTAAGAGSPAGGGLQQISDYNAELSKIGLPIGWSSEKPGDKAGFCAIVLGAVKDHSLGWLLTAIAISMGAPFWFDLLDKIIAVRTSLKPQTGN